MVGFARISHTLERIFRNNRTRNNAAQENNEEDETMKKPMNKCIVCKKKNTFGTIYKGHVCHTDCYDSLILCGTIKKALNKLKTLIHKNTDCYDQLMLCRTTKKDLNKLSTLIYKIAKKGAR